MLSPFMVKLVQILKDSLLIVRTDRRVWSAVGFVVIALSVWSATSVWRDNIAPSQVHKSKPPEEPGRRQAIVDFQEEWELEKKNRAEFRENLTRSVNSIRVDKDEIEWHANKLVDKLNGMTIKVDQIIAGIGQTRLEKAKLNEKIAKQKSKNVKKVINIDRSELNSVR